MPRADKMKDKTKVFYWADTGPVEAHLNGSYITRAQTVEWMSMPGPGYPGERPLIWESEEESTS